MRTQIRARPLLSGPSQTMAGIIHFLRGAKESHFMILSRCNLSYMVLIMSLVPVWKRASKGDKEPEKPTRE